ncbi:MAG: three-Cys-motif partner protein TcmP [Hyphomicrobiales bacterium]
MGRSPKNRGRVIGHPTLWSPEELPQTAEKFPEKNFQSLRFPLWTQNKARLIEEYLRLFQYVTRHGNYIDGFAAPQEAEHLEMWAAKRVLEMTPKWFRNFWLCDIDPKGVAKLAALKSEHETPQRQVFVLSGDFNKSVANVLKSEKITEKTATFALLDQRTFECDWETVRRLSLCKKENKIEIFYFFATGWIDRSIAAVRAPVTVDRVEKWWGRDDWRNLQGMDSTRRAKLISSRFEDELGYGKATPYPIHSELRGGRTMYHMIHATDHPEASPLMIRAYRKVSGRHEIDPADAQADFDELWQRLTEDRD